MTSIEQSAAAMARYVAELERRVAELEALNAERNRDTERFEWFFGVSDKLPFMSNYLLGIRESWTPNQWRAAIDAAMGGREQE